MYEIRPAGPKGLGVFAKSLIPIGTRIFSERPLISLHPNQSASDIYTLSRLLSPSQRSQLLSLSSHITTSLRFMRWNQAIYYTLKSFSKNFPFLLPRYCHFEPQRPASPRNSISEHVRILSIFRSNAFNLSTEKIYQAVFPGISRINHDCVPNAQGNWNQGMERFNVHATRDIEGGEEVTLSYLGEVGAIRERRGQDLGSGYGFECGCQACDLDSEVGRRGEENRAGIKHLLQKYAEGVSSGGQKCGEQELKVLMAFLRMLEGEGVAGREVASMYLEAARLNESMGRMEKALKCARRAEEVDRACLGIDHETYLATNEVDSVISSAIEQFEYQSLIVL
ncbi:SET domain-containing protein [Mollisia scopiformis]|uniref:SET domain-containing protein n=1 Tax=Mollisia scopiformis TaxID=149040 RepID=A0A194WWM9_MOLSC|nr:SET domain-containing protein [Mollisia scopiformis]KUJ11987.1 SET domain-containing protein [Mollisia scopiformis]